MPGIMRGLTVDTGGLVLTHNCWRNHRWIRVDNCNDWLDAEQALSIVMGIDALMPPAAAEALSGWTPHRLLLTQAMMA